MHPQLRNPRLVGILEPPTVGQHELVVDDRPVGDAALVIAFDHDTVALPWAIAMIDPDGARTADSATRRSPHLSDMGYPHRHQYLSPLRAVSLIWRSTSCSKYRVAVAIRAIAISSLDHALT